MTFKEQERWPILTTNQSLIVIKSIPSNLSNIGVIETYWKIQNVLDLLDDGSAREAANDSIHLNLPKRVCAAQTKVRKLIRQKLEDWNISCNKKASR